MSETYAVRQFLPNEAMTYKAMRLEALQNEPGMFGNSYAMEAAYADEHWQNRIANPMNAIFGLYSGDELTGITAVIISSDKPGEAYMTQSYIQKAFRGQGLSVLLYEARIQWAKEHEVTVLRIGHRASNLVSKAANQKFGFAYTHSEPRTWPDGATDDMLYYEVKLADRPYDMH